MPTDPESPFAFGNPGGIHGGGSRTGLFSYVAARLRLHPLERAIVATTFVILAAVVIVGTVQPLRSKMGSFISDIGIGPTKHSAHYQ